MKRFERTAGAIFAVVWAVTIVLLWTGPPPLDRFPAPRSLFPLAAILGWTAGNVFVSRLRAAALPRRGLVALYLGGPPGVLWLLWSLVPRPIQAYAPLAPLLSLGIYGIFFLVPVTVRRR